jgi:tRNA U38,U39,U40 pseudouridine synthase TruA
MLTHLIVLFLKPVGNKQQWLILRFRLIVFENMVRSIVGTLVNVGLNKITLDDFNAIIVHKTEIKLGFQYQHMVCID